MPNEILSDAINAVCRGEELSEDTAATVLREVMEGRSTPEETAGLLIALRTRGETRVRAAMSVTRRANPFPDRAAMPSRSRGRCLS